MEGKEVRFGITDSAMFATITTDTSCGCVNSFHDSYTPLGGLVLLADIAPGRDRLWWRRRWPLRDVDVRHSRGLYRGLDGRAHARVPGQEDRAQGDDDGRAGLADLTCLDPGLLGAGAASSRRGSVQLPIQGRMDFRRFSTLTPPPTAIMVPPLPDCNGNTPVLQLDAGHCLPDWALRLPDPAPGFRRLARQEARRARRAGNVPHDGPALRWSLDRRDSHCGRAHLLPGVCAGADCRTVADACGKDVLRCKLR